MSRIPNTEKNLCIWKPWWHSKLRDYVLVFVVSEYECVECPLDCCFLFSNAKNVQWAWFILLIFDTGCCNPAVANPDLNIWSGFRTADLDSSESDTDFPVLNFSNQKFILKLFKSWFTTYGILQHIFRFFRLATKRRGRRIRILIRNSGLRIRIRKKCLWFLTTGSYLYPNALLAWILFLFVRK